MVPSCLIPPLLDVLFFPLVDGKEVLMCDGYVPLTICREDDDVNERKRPI